jgi:CRISPR-associated endonuclease/helicase Cas3
VDFGGVIRFEAGLDSIAQAAGRCNREGKLQCGKVVVFVPPKPSPVGHLRRAEQTTTSILAGHDGPLLTRDNFRRYFEQFYATAHSWDKHDIDHLLSSEAGQAQVQFRTAAERFKLIEESGYQSIFVYYDEASRTLIGRLQKEGPERWLMRKLQRYCVNVPQYQFKELQKNGDVREAYAGLYVQASDALYDMKLGLMVGECCVSQESLVL